MSVINNCLNIKNNEYFVEEYSIKDLTKKYGSPLYIYSKEKIEKKCTLLLNNFNNKMSNHFQLCYAVKANSNISILKIIKEMGIGADCASAMEIKSALLAGFNPKKCLFTAVNPTKEDLQEAFDNNLIMNLDDISIWPQVKKLGIPETISFRVNPGLGAGKFAQIVVGGEGTKFGMNSEKALLAYKQAKDDGVKKFGLHMMTGSCILDSDYFLKITSKIIQICSHISAELNIDFEFIDIGGGLGIPYEKEEHILDIESLAKNLSEHYINECKTNNLKLPKLFMEPGRYLVGDGGILASTVSQIKVEKQKNFLGLDAGMTTLLRPALYGAYHEIEPIDLSKKGTKKWDVVGPICETTDCFAKDRKIGDLNIGDVVIFHDAGAYCFAMSSHFNGRLRPAEVLVDGKSANIIRKRETFQDEINLQVFSE